MKTKILAALVVLIACINASYAQQLDEASMKALMNAKPSEFITEVCGIKFGTPKAQARKILIEKYGKPLSESPSEIEFGSIENGNIKYQYATFMFSENADSPLYAVQFTWPCCDKEEAKDIVEIIRKDLAKNYTLVRINKKFKADSCPATLNYIGGRSERRFYGFFIMTMKLTTKKNYVLPYNVCLTYSN